MNLDQVVTFDIVRAAPPRRLWPWVLTLLLLVALVVVLVHNFDAGGGGTHERSFTTPQQALTYLCSHYLAAEHVFTSGQGTDAARFEQKLAELPDPHMYSPSLQRFLYDQRDIANQLATYAAIGGASTTDMHQLCRR